MNRAKTWACIILLLMGKLLEQAIEKVRELPEDQQDMAAAELIGCLADFPTPNITVALYKIL
jgi:hypothetical protein